MNERERVIRDLLVRLKEVGIEPERSFLADFIPGKGWVFSQGEDDDEELPRERETGASSLPAGVHKR